MQQQLKTSGSFPRGIVIGGVTYKTFEMREAEVVDMIDAEAEGGLVGSLKYHLELAVRQLVKVASVDGQEFKGPFVGSMISKRQDFAAIRTAQVRLDEMGNDEPSASEATGTPSS